MEKAVARRRTTFILTGLVVILLIGSGYLVFTNNQIQSTIGSQHSQISSLSSENSDLAGKVTGLSSQTSSLRDELSDLNTENARLHGNNTNLELQISVLQDKLKSTNSTIQADAEQISSLSAQLKNLTDILNLKKSSTVLSQTTVTVPRATTCPYYEGCVTTGSWQYDNFTAFPYAGYLLVRVYSTNATLSPDVSAPYIQANWQFEGQSSNNNIAFFLGKEPYYVQVPGFVVIPVLPSMDDFYLSIGVWDMKAMTISISIEYWY